MTIIDTMIFYVWVYWRRAVIAYYAATGRSEEDLLRRLRERRW